MTHPLITNQTLKKIIKEARIDEEQRKELLEKLPYMDKLRRVKLLSILKDAVLRELEKNPALNL